MFYCYRHQNENAIQASNDKPMRLHIFAYLLFFSSARMHARQHFIFNQKPIMSLGSSMNTTETTTTKKNEVYGNDEMDLIE